MSGAELMTVIAIVIPALGGLVIFTGVARWLYRMGDKPPLPGEVGARHLASGEETRQLLAELDGARTRIEELERRLERVDDRSAFVEKLLEKPAEQR